MTSEANSSKTAYIKEIFRSIQGEGPYIGFEQLFIRFSGCNLKCAYCDTDFSSDLKEYSPESLINETNKYYDFHSISLTGGEPLLHADFLREFLRRTNKTIYLETNATLVSELEKTIKYIDIVSADIKLNSSSKNGDLFDVHDEFIATAKNFGKEIFAKVVFDSEITDFEIEKTCKIASKNDIQIILQPRTLSDKIAVNIDDMTKIFDKFLEKHNKVRLIPQMHKYINVK